MNIILSIHHKWAKLILKDIHDPGIACAICRNTMTTMRGRAFQICDDCLKNLREIINERRKPKVVEIGGIEYMEKGK